MTDVADFTTSFGRWLAHSLWQGGLVLLAYLLFRRLVRRTTSDAECRIATVGAVLIAVLPALTAVTTVGLSRVAPMAGLEVGAAAEPVLRRLTFDVTRWLVWFWLGGAVLTLLHLLHSAWRLHLRLTRESRPTVIEGFEGLVHRAGLVRAPAVREWPKATSPFVTGWLRPAVVLPVGLDRLLTRLELEAVLLHELAHVARRDVAVNLGLRLMGVLAWYQLPLRVLLRDLGRARERSCDERAVRAMGGSLPLARALVRLEERRSGGLRLAMAGTGGELTDRVRRILAGIGGAAPAGAPGRAPLATAGLLVVTVTSLLLAGSAEDRHSRLANGVHAFIHAQDPAGPFTVELRGPRVVAATIDGQEVPPGRIVQDGSRVALLDPAGQPELTLRVDAPGGINWSPRPPRSP